MEYLHKPLIGLYEKALPHSTSLNKKIKIAKTSGFDFIEISIDESREFLSRLDWSMDERKKLVKSSRDYKLPLFSMSLSGHRKYPLGSADKNIRQKAKDMLGKTIDLACDLGVRVIQVLGYWVYYEPITTDSENYYLDGLSWGIEKAAKRGVMIGIENVDSHQQINAITKAVKYVHDFNSPWFQIYGDFANLAAFGFDVPSELEAGKGHFASIHVKDSILDEVRGIPFGEGIVNFNTAFNTLADGGYNGPFLMEMWSENSKEPANTAMDVLNKVKTILNNSHYHPNF